MSKWLLKAGFLPLPWFLAWTSLGACFATDYEWMRDHASVLSLQDGMPRIALGVGAIGSGIAFILFSIGLWTRSDRLLPVGAVCWAIFGVAMVSNGWFPMGGPLHGLYAIGLVNLVAPALALLELPSQRDRSIAYLVTAFVSFAGVVYLWLNLMGFDPAGYQGLTQRVFSSINSAWPAVVAFLLLREQDEA